MMPVWHAGRPGSIPGGSTETEGSRITVRRAALLTRAAFTGMGVQFPPLPLTDASVVKRNHHSALRTRRSRFESWPGYLGQERGVRREDRAKTVLNSLLAPPDLVA